MKKTHILICSVILSSLATVSAYSLFIKSSTSQETQDFSSTSNEGLHENIDVLSRKLDILQKAESFSQEKIEERYASIRKSLDAQESKLSRLSKKDELDNKTVDSGSKPQRKSSPFRSWLDNNVEGNTSNESITRDNFEQLFSLISQREDIELYDLHCSPEVCRATLEFYDGTKPSMAGLRGHKPFIRSTISTPEDENRLSVYYTLSDIGFSELKKKAVSDKTI